MLHSYARRAFSSIILQLHKPQDPKSWTPTCPSPPNPSQYTDDHFNSISKNQPSNKGLFSPSHHIPVPRPTKNPFNNIHIHPALPSQPPLTCQHQQSPPQEAPSYIYSEVSQTQEEKKRKATSLTYPSPNNYLTIPYPTLVHPPIHPPPHQRRNPNLPSSTISIQLLYTAITVAQQYPQYQVINTSSFSLYKFPKIHAHLRSPHASIPQPRRDYIFPEISQ